MSGYEIVRSTPSTLHVLEGPMEQVSNGDTVRLCSKCRAYIKESDWTLPTCAHELRLVRDV